MSEENIELVRRALESFEAFVGMLDEYVICDFRPYRLPDAPEVLIGRDSVADAMRSFMATFDEYRLEPLDLASVGSDVVIELAEHGVGKGSGIPLERRWAWVWSFRAGRLIRMEPHRSRASAAAAAGLSE